MHNKLLNDETRNMINIDRQLKDEYYDWIEELWNLFRPYAPNDFKNNFINDSAKFYGLTWEMLLASKLIEKGYLLERVTNMNSPDLCLRGNYGERIWVECCYAARGDSLPRNIMNPPESIEVDMDRNILRITSLIKSKIAQHKRWLEKNICNDSESFIIAINGHDLDLGIYNNTLPDVARAVYPIGNLHLFFHNNMPGTYSEYSEQEAIFKKPGVQVSKDCFLTKDNQQIAGLLYSNDWWGCCTTNPNYVYVPNILTVTPCQLDLSALAKIIYGGRDPDHITTINSNF